MVAIRKPKHGRSKIRAWRDPSRPVTWYPAAWLSPDEHIDRTVALSGNGSEFMGQIGIDAGSGLPAWQRWCGFARQWITVAPWRLIDGGVTTQWEPNAFRPVPGEESEWEGLPPPLPAIPHAAPDDAGTFIEPPIIREDDGWPYPVLPLGCLEPATCAREAEARVLRGLRRMRMESDGRPQGRRSTSLDIPAEFFRLMRRLDDEQERDGQPGDVVAAWIPTRRDSTDWLYALDWWRRLGAEHRDLFLYRAANPSFSFAQIGDRERCAPDTAKHRYYRAVDLLFDIARRSPRASQP